MLAKGGYRKRCKFAAELKKYTDCKVSINFFNLTNYEEKDLLSACDAAAKANVDFMYFADTHGGLDLGDHLETFQRFTKQIKEAGMTLLHLPIIPEKPTDYRNPGLQGLRNRRFLGGIGKGLGNLKLEHVFNYVVESIF